MIKRLATSFAVISLCAGAAHGQHRLTGEVYKPIGDGIGRLTEDEVLKLVPGPITVRFDDVIGDPDYVLTWEEVRRIQVEFLDGKVSSATGTFSDVVSSKTLTLENLKKVAQEMKRQDVEKLLDRGADGGSFREQSAKDSKGREVQACEWEQGRVIWVYIKGGKVTGGSYTDTSEDALRKKPKR